MTDSETAVAPLEQRVKALEEKLAEAVCRIDALKHEDRVCIVCFSGEWDRLFAALTIASGALSLGQEVHLFFTFWAVSALRPHRPVKAGKRNFSQVMLAKMLPAGMKAAPLSKMNFMGMGKRMLGKIMKKQGVADIDQLLKDIKDLGARFYLCETSAGLFGLNCDELVEGDTMKKCGVATFMSLALKSKVVLFV
jgi:peroxiredoxin family protein